MQSDLAFIPDLVQSNEPDSVVILDSDVEETECGVEVPDDGNEQVCLVRMSKCLGGKQRK